MNEFIFIMAEFVTVGTAALLAHSILNSRALKVEPDFIAYLSNRGIPIALLILVLFFSIALDIQYDYQRILAHQLVAKFSLATTLLFIFLFMKYRKSRDASDMTDQEQ